MSGLKRRNPFDESEVDERKKTIEFYLKVIDAWLCEESKATENFDTAFFESLHNQFCMKNDLSDKQIYALKNIYDKWIDNPQGEFEF